MRDYKYFTKEEDSFILAHTDKLVAWVAEQLNRPIGSVVYRRKVLGITKSRKLEPISDETRERIIEMREQGEMMKVIAAETGVELTRVKSLLDYARLKGKIKNKTYKNDIPFETYPPMRERMKENHVYALMSGGHTVTEGNVYEIAKSADVELKEMRRMLRDSYLRDADGKRWKYLLYLYDENEME